MALNIKGVFVNHRISIIALSIGILFGILAFFMLYQKTSEIEKKATPIEILIASRYIPAGSILNSNMVIKKLIPESFVSPSAIQDIKEVDNQVVLVPISSGEQILSNKFGSNEDSLAFNLNNGYRAYTIEVNETSGVGNLIRPGNHVDLLAKISLSKHEITTFVFQDIQVLAVGQKMARTSNKQKDSEANDNYNTATLALTPDQSETLMHLDGQHLRLLLRAPNDTEIVSIPPKNETEIISELGRFTSSEKRGLQSIKNSQKDKD